MAAAFREGAAEAAAAGIADPGCCHVRAAANRGAQAVPAPSAVVVAVGEDGDETAVAVGSLLRLVGLVLTEAVVDDVVVLVDTALHLRFATASKERECRGGEKRCGDLRRTLHR